MIQAGGQLLWLLVYYWLSAYKQSHKDCLVQGTGCRHIWGSKYHHPAMFSEDQTVAIGGASRLHILLPARCTCDQSEEQVVATLLTAKIQVFSVSSQALKPRSVLGSVSLCSKFLRPADSLIQLVCMCDWKR